VTFIEDPGVDGKMVLEYIERWEDMDWMHLAQDRDQWRALLNMVMNLSVSQKAGNFLTS
jgi:hypothetical protein